MTLFAKLERAEGIEPSYAAWEAAVLPLNYARKRLCLHRYFHFKIYMARFWHGLAPWAPSHVASINPLVRKVDLYSKANVLWRAMEKIILPPPHRTGRTPGRTARRTRLSIVGHKPGRLFANSC